MPVTLIVNGKQEIRESYRYGCHNRPPLKDAVTMQDGWTKDGRRNMVENPFTMSRDCGYARHGYADTDDACSG